MSRQDIATVIGEWEEERRRLYRLLRSHDARVLTVRPPNGDWSIIENVRHLLFAEQAHLGRFLPDGFAWSAVGLTSVKKPELAIVGSKPTKDIDEVFRAWDEVHAPIRKAVKNSKDPDVAYRLERHLGHLRRHVEGIQKLLRKANTRARPSRP